MVGVQRQRCYAHLSTLRVPPEESLVMQRLEVGCYPCIFSMGML